LIEATRRAIEMVAPSTLNEEQITAAFDAAYVADGMPIAEFCITISNELLQYRDIGIQIEVFRTHLLLCYIEEMESAALHPPVSQTTVSRIASSSMTTRKSRVYLPVEMASTFVMELLEMNVMCYPVIIIMSDHTGQHVRHGFATEPIVDDDIGDVTTICQRHSVEPFAIIDVDGEGAR